MLKHYFIIVILFLIGLSVISQPVFGPEVMLTDEVANPLFLKMVDLNNDGFIDVIANSGSEGKDLVWFKNLNNSGYARQEILISFTDYIFYYNCIDTIDFDNDGLVDILNAHGSKVSVFLNDDLEFEDEIIIFDTLSDIINVKVADIDNDEDLDIMLISGINPYEIKYLENDGDGNYDNIITVETDMIWTDQLLLEDIDGDDDLDLITNSGSWAMIYINNGDGSFTFSQTIQGHETAFVKINLSDLDSDLDLDLIISTSFMFDELNFVKWYENDGTGTFAFHNTFGSDTLEISSMESGDWDNDGDNDILLGSHHPARIVLCDNDGIGGFEMHNIWVDDEGSSSYQTLPAMIIGDCDADDDKDVFFTLSRPGNDSNGIWYLENDGIENQHPYALALKFKGDISLSVADITLNSFNDIVYSSTWYGGIGHIACFNNMSDLNFKVQNVLSNFNGVKNLYLSDLDNDNDLDIIGSNLQTIYKIENLNGDIFDMEEVIGSTSGVQSHYTIHLNDFNNDGFIDIAAAVDSDKLAWYMNIGFGYFLLQPIDDVPSISSVISADIDNDLDFDIVVTLWESDQILLYKNLGNGYFDSRTIINSPYNYPFSLYCSDIDGDNNSDIIVEYDFEDYSLVWFKNDGNENFSPNFLLFGITTTEICMADLNGDNLDEIIFNNYLTDKLGYKINDGSGNFGSSNYLEGNWNDLSNIIAADLNNDGDNEIIASNRDGKIAYYPNLLINNVYENNSNPPYSCYPNPALDFLYIKGLKQNDIVELYDSNSKRLIISRKPQFSIQEFANGLYFIVVRNEMGNVLWSEKVLKY